MSIIISQHPMITEAQAIADICKPLDLFNINLFSHVMVNDQSEMTAIANHPEFVLNYFENNYHHADIHAAKNNHFGEFVLWDSLNCKGETDRMLQDAANFGHRQFFTLIEKDAKGSHFYHFASATSSPAMTQLYLSNIDALKQFIAYFKDSINDSKELVKSHELKITIEETHDNCELILDDRAIEMGACREAFLNDLSSNSRKNLAIRLSKQQRKCLELLVLGYSARDIGDTLHLSTRTVESYLDKIRRLYNCRSSKELIAVYYSKLI